MQFDQLKRRDFITLVGGAAASWPFAARAQQPAKLAHIGFLDLGPASARASQVEALRGGLRHLGYIEGRDLVFVFRWADSIERVPELAAELVRINVDIIVGTSSTMVEAARQATQSIPIVFFAHADPVGIGHVASLARPGGNITGLSMLLTEMVTKELEISKELVPGRHSPRCSLESDHALPCGCYQSGGSRWSKTRSSASLGIVSKC